MIDAFFENVQPGCISALLLYKANFREGLNTEKNTTFPKHFYPRRFSFLNCLAPVLREASSKSSLSTWALHLVGGRERGGGRGVESYFGNAELPK